jgi:hypothetical protein
VVWDWVGFWGVEGGQLVQEGVDCLDAGVGESAMGRGG